MIEKNIISLSFLSNLFRNHFVKGSINSFIIQIGFSGLALLNAVLLSRFLGSEGYGAFANAMAWVSLFIIPASFGFGTLLVRKIPIFTSRSDWDSLRSLLKISDNFVFILSLIIVFFGILLINFVFANSGYGVMYYTLLIAMPLIPIFAFIRLREASLRGFGLIFRAFLPGMIFRPTLLLLGISIFYVHYNKLTPSIAMIINVIASCISLFIIICWFENYLPNKVREADLNYEIKPHLKVAFPLMIFSGMQIAQSQIPIAMLGLMGSPKEVAQYAIASRLAYLLTYLMYASEVVMAPIISRLYDQKEFVKLQDILIKWVRAVFVISLPFSLLMILLREHILTAFGPDYIIGEFVFIILIIATLINIMLGPSPLLLAMAGFEKITAIVMSLTVLLNIIFNLIFISKYGIIGAALASAISLILMKLLLCYYSIIKTGQHVTIIGVSKY